FPSMDEQSMVAATGISLALVPLIGVLETVFAVAMLVFWRWRQLFLWNVLLMAGALIAVALASPRFLVAAFTPVTLNAAVILLSIVGYIASSEIPTASHCLRQPPKERT